MLDLMTSTKRLNQYQTNFPFKAPDTLAPPKIQGTWAELLVIEQSRQPEILINAWHSTPSSPYGFSLGRDKIVVKYTDAEQRIHPPPFALDQLRHSIPARILVASTVVRQCVHYSGGLSLKDLYGRIMARVTADDSRLRLYSYLAQTVGIDLVQFEEIRFDYASAVDYLEYYDSADVPCIDPATIPVQVSGVSFTSDLTGLEDVRKRCPRFDLSSSALFRSLI